MKIKMGKVITVTSSKGGIGKTVFTLNLAGMYHLMGLKTLVIDMDLYAGGVAVSLNLKEGKTIYNLVDDIMNNRYHDAYDYLCQYNENVYILPSCKDPRQGSKIENRFIEQIINIYKSRFDVILLDTTHVLVDTKIVALDNSDVIAYMISNDPIDLANTKSMMAIFDDIKKDNVKIILNNSFSLDKGYFSLFDIKSVINRNIDYTLNKSFYIKNIDRYIMDGDILILNKKLSFNNKKDYERLLLIAKDLVGGVDE